MRPLSGISRVEDVVVRGDAVAGDEQQVVVVDAVELANLAAGQMLVVGQSWAHRASLSAGINPMTSRYRAVRHHTRPTARAADQRRRRGRCGPPCGCWSGWPCTPRSRRSPRSAGRSNDGANGVADNLNSAGDSATGVPLIGDALSKPLRAASRGGPRHRRAPATASTRPRAGWRRAGTRRRGAADPGGRDAVAVPAGAVLPSQVDGADAGGHARRRTAAGAAGAGQPAAGQARGRQHRPRRRLARPTTARIHGLAALELRAAGVRRRP